MTVLDMQIDRRCRLVVVALVALLGAAARAAPPTVTPSPGYDARLQESRKPTATTSAPDQSATSTDVHAPATPRHDARRKPTH